MSRRRSASSAMGPPPDRDVVMGPPPVPAPSATSHTAPATQKHKNEQEIADKYRKLKRRFFELEEKHKETSSELQRSSERNVKMREERSYLLDRIIELESSGASSASSSQAAPIAQPNSSAFPRTLLSTRARTSFIANLRQAIAEDGADDDDDPVLTSRHIGLEARRRAEEERRSEDVRDSKRSTRKTRASLPQTSNHKGKETGNSGTAQPLLNHGRTQPQLDSISAGNSSASVSTPGTRLRIKPLAPPGVTPPPPDRMSPPILHNTVPSSSSASSSHVHSHRQSPLPNTHLQADSYALSPPPLSLQSQQPRPHSPSQQHLPIHQPNSLSLTPELQDEIHHAPRSSGGDMEVDSEVGQQPIVPDVSSPPVPTPALPTQVRSRRRSSPQLHGRDSQISALDGNSENSESTSICEKTAPSHIPEKVENIVNRRETRSRRSSRNTTDTQSAHPENTRRDQRNHAERSKKPRDHSPMLASRKATSGGRTTRSETAAIAAAAAAAKQRALSPSLSPSPPREPTPMHVDNEPLNPIHDSTPVSPRSSISRALDSAESHDVKMEDIAEIKNDDVTSDWTPVLDPPQPAHDLPREDEMASENAAPDPEPEASSKLAVSAERSPRSSASEPVSSASPNTRIDNPIGEASAVENTIMANRNSDTIETTPEKREPDYSVAPHSTEASANTSQLSSPAALSSQSPVPTTVHQNQREETMHSSVELENIIKVAAAVVAAQNAAKSPPPLDTNGSSPSSSVAASGSVIDPNLDPSLLAESTSSSNTVSVSTHHNGSGVSNGTNGITTNGNGAIPSASNIANTATSTPSPTSSLSSNPYLSLSTAHLPKVNTTGSPNPSAHLTPLSGINPYSLYYTTPGTPITPSTPTYPYGNPYYYLTTPMAGPSGMHAPSPTFAPPSVSQRPPSESQRQGKPKRLKAHTVTSKSFSIPMVPRDKSGKPMLPLNVGIMTVINLGDVCMREHFHTERYIFPVGYEVTRRYLSTIDPTIEVVYHCTILDGGDGPKFQIVPSDVPERPVIAGTATGAWSSIVKQANAIRNRQHSNSVSGPDFFGLGQNTIKHLIQELPNADRLRDYVWQNFVEGGPLGGRHAAVIPALPDEYDASMSIGAYFPSEREKMKREAQANANGNKDGGRGMSHYPQHILAQAEAQRAQQQAIQHAKQQVQQHRQPVQQVAQKMAQDDNQQQRQPTAQTPQGQQQSVQQGLTQIVLPPPTTSETLNFQEYQPLVADKRSTRSTSTTSQTASARTTRQTSLSPGVRTEMRHTRSSSRGQVQASTNSPYLPNGNAPASSTSPPPVPATFASIMNAYPTPGTPGASGS